MSSLHLLYVLDLDIVIVRLSSKILLLFKEIISVCVIFGRKWWVLHAEGFTLVVVFGVSLWGHQTKWWVPFFINLGHIVLPVPERRHHTRVDITTGDVVIDHLGRRILSVVILRTRYTLISWFLHVTGLSPAWILLVRILAIHIYFAYIVINKLNDRMDLKNTSHLLCKIFIKFLIY